VSFGPPRAAWRWLLALSAALVLALALGAALSLWFELSMEAGAAVASSDAASAPGTASRVQQGAYLARLGNCAGCHTARGGAALAGARALPTPFGDVYAGNLTPDDDTGLGRWSADDFWRALHLGRSRDGRLLLPVFPYPHFTHVTRADSDALYAYLRSVKAVRSATPPHALRFPYNTQAALAVWRLLYFRPAAAAATAPAASIAALPQASTLQRGAYLVQGLGHCGACHAPRNTWGAAGRQLTGGDMPGQRWHAPSLLPGQPGQGSVRDTVALLKTGGSALGRASGPMAAVVGSSLQHWSDDDLRAVVVYLQSLPAQPPTAAAPVAADAGRQRLGDQLYRRHCRDCHGDSGEGVPGIYPALAGNATVLQPTALNLVQIIIHGGFGPSTAGNPRPFGMPPLVLSDPELAALATHVRQSWGNRAAAVSDLEILQLR
jgi:mono/diheme cytochrome c family protein